MNGFDGLEMNLGSLPRLSHAQTRSISAENPSGAKGRGAMADPDPNGPARELGRGWKCRPCKRDIPPGEVYTLADIGGSGAIQSMWFGGNVTRDMILRFYWEDQASAAIECPICDFFCMPWTRFHEGRQGGPLVQVNSLPVAVNPNRGLNCFWVMPFRERCRITIQNLHPSRPQTCFYQINYTLTDVPEECAYLHAQFRRVNPLPYGEVYTIVDGIRGRGQYVGTSMGVGVNHSGWWGEGEIKFYIDGDAEYPTLCGTGTEDYFGGSYNWDVEGQYVTYSTPFMGMHQVLRPDGSYNSQHRHAMYRWHVMDPIRFESDLRVTIQALGWRSEGRYLPGQHDICSVAYWYQSLPAAPFPKLPDRSRLEVV
jgi:hypothetical protein